jgi:muramoyltetrapeptide carboxypeptidase LdcA involved in peptidoglycan recycling
LPRERGELDGAIAVLEHHIDTWYGAEQLAELLLDQGDLDAVIALLSHHEEAGASFVSMQLDRLLRERGDDDELPCRADAGSGHAASQLAESLHGRGHLDEAVNCGVATALPV